MFLKVTRSKNRQYLQIVHSYRENGKPRHKVVANLGSFDQLEGNPVLLSLGKRLLKLAGRPAREELSDLELEEEGRYCYGHEVYRWLWNKLKLSDLVTQMLKRRRISFDVENTLYFLLIERLLHPASKLSSYLNQDRYLGIRPVSLQHEYRLLEVLADEKTRIEQFLFAKQRDLFHLKVDVVFYDMTTFHFESVRADELRNFGFSKEGKFNEVQVMLGLLINADGLPIGYDLYPGNTFEGNTLVDALEKLSQRFQIGRLIFVADRGLNSAPNLSVIAQKGYQYIVATPLRRKSNALKEKLLQQEGYHQQLDPTTGELTFKYKWLDHKTTYKVDQSGQDKQKTHTLEDKLLVSWSANRARRDAQKRARILQKAQQAIDQGKTTTSSRGASRYFKTKGKQQILGLDSDKIEQDQKWDGLHGLQTNALLSEKQIWEAYNQLWKIEDAFRTLKSTMNTRPIFHWSPKRIEGHFALCFLAFLLERTLELKLKKNNLNLSPQKIKELINSIEVSKVNINKQPYYLKAKLDPQAASLLRICRIKQPQNLTPIEEWELD